MQRMNFYSQSLSWSFILRIFVLNQMWNCMHLLVKVYIWLVTSTFTLQISMCIQWLISVYIYRVDVSTAIYTITSKCKRVLNVNYRNETLKKLESYIKNATKYNVVKSTIIDTSKKKKTQELRKLEIVICKLHRIKKIFPNLTTKKEKKI